jgi:hypothetical protein
MPHKYFADQMDDEEVQYVFRKHPVVMRKGLIIGMLIILLSVVPVAIKPTLGFGWFFGSLGIGMVVALVFFTPSWISWYYSIFILSDQRLIQITQKGLFNKAVVDMQLSQIQMVNYQIAGLQETMLGFGTLVMQTYMGDLVVHDVHHPAKTQKKILEVLRDNGVMAASYGAESPERRPSTDMELETEEDSEE